MALARVDDVKPLRPHAGEQASGGVVDGVGPRDVKDRHIKVVLLPLNPAQHLLGWYQAAQRRAQERLTRLRD